MDLVDRKAVLEAIRLGMTVTQLEREINAIPQVSLDEVMEERFRQFKEGMGDVPGRYGYWKRQWQDEYEDRSAIQGINPGLAELIKANQEIVRLRKYVVRQHDYFTGKDVPDLIVTTGTDYEDVQIQEEKPSND
jgi:hypothetical protein